MKKRPESDPVIECVATGRIVRPDAFAEVNVGDTVVPIAAPDYGLQSYEPGTLYVNEDGGVFAFRPGDNPDVVYVVVDDIQHKVIHRNGRVFVCGDGGEILYDLMVDGADRKAARAASCLLPDRPGSDN